MNVATVDTKPSQDKSRPDHLVLFFIYILAVIEIFASREEEEFFAPEKVAYLAFFAFTIIIWLSSNMLKGTFLKPFSQEKTNLLVILFIVYALTIAPLVGMIHDVPTIMAFKGSIRLTNLLLIPIIFSILTTREKMWNLYIMLFFLVLTITLFETRYIMQTAQGQMLQKRVYGEEICSAFYIVGLPLLIPMMRLFKVRATKYLLYFVVCLLFSLFLLRMFLSFHRIHLLTLLSIPFLITFINMISHQGEIKNAVRWMVIFLALTVIVLMLNWQYGIFDLYIVRFEKLESGFTSRMSEWEVALQGFSDSPILGTGSGTKINFFKRGERYEYSHMHNMVIYFLFHFGIIGSLIYFSIWTTFFASAYRLLRKVKMQEKDIVMLMGCVLSAVAIIIFSMVETAAGRQETNFLFAILIAMVLRLKWQYRRELKAPLPQRVGSNHKRAPAPLRGGAVRRIP